jgi:hypothetical protein
MLPSGWIEESTAGQREVDRGRSPDRAASASSAASKAHRFHLDDQLVGLFPQLFGNCPQEASSQRRLSVLEGGEVGEVTLGFDLRPHELCNARLARPPGANSAMLAFVGAFERKLGQLGNDVAMAKRSSSAFSTARFSQEADEAAHPWH